MLDSKQMLSFLSPEYIRATSHSLMELASAVILFPLPEAMGDAVHLLAQTPAAVLDLSLMQAAVSAWTWVMAEGSARIKVRLCSIAVCTCLYAASHARAATILSCSHRCCISIQ